MKKYLLFACALGAAALTSCQDEEFGYDAESISYEKAFINEFGDVDPNQDWLGEAGIIDAVKGLTRATGDYSWTTSTETYGAWDNTKYITFAAALVNGIYKYVPNGSSTNLSNDGVTSNFSFYSTTKETITLYPVFTWATRNWDTNQVGIYILNANTNTVTVYAPFWKGSQSSMDTTKGNHITYSTNGTTYTNWTPTSNKPGSGSSESNPYAYYKNYGFEFAVEAGTIWGLYITGNKNTSAGTSVSESTTTNYFNLADLNPSNVVSAANFTVSGASVTFHDPDRTNNVDSTVTTVKCNTFEDMPNCSSNNDYNDIMFVVESKSITIPYTEAQYRVMSEDLGAIYNGSYVITDESGATVSKSDLDFNDIVFDIFHKDKKGGSGIDAEEGEEKMTITLQAVGGDLPIYLYYTNGTGNEPTLVGGKELHLAMGGEIDESTGNYRPINVGAKNGMTIDEVPSFEIACNKDFNMVDFGQYFTIEVGDDRTGTTIYTPFVNNKGKVPQAFVTNQTVMWTNENESIASKYSGFTTWVGDATSWNWYEKTFTNN